MINYFQKYYIFSLFFLLLVIDKFIVFSPLNKCCLFQSFEIENSYLESIQKKIKTTDFKNKKFVLSIGSSLSYGYYYSDNFNSNDFLTSQEIHNIENYKIITIALPGTSYLTTYVFLNKLIENGIKPDLVLLETSPALFNGNTPWYRFEIIKQISISFILNNFTEIPFNHICKVIFSKIFSLSSYNIGLPNKNFNINKNEFWNLIIRNYLKNLPIPIPPSFKEGEEIVDSTNVLIGLKKNFKSFEIEKDLVQYFNQTVDLLEENKIQSIFWFPALTKNSLLISQPILNSLKWKLLIEYIKNRKINYIDMNQLPARNCNYFLDPTHMGYQCFAEAFLLKLKRLED